MMSPIMSFYHFKAAQFNIANSQEAVHPVIQYKMNVKQVSSLPIHVDWIADEHAQLLHLHYLFNNEQEPISKNV